jgi:SAM-dependent methyltransferase
MEKDGLSVDLSVGNTENIPYSDSFFDGVIDNECLYCNSLENTRKILGEIKRVMKTGGLFYSRTFTNDMDIGCTQTKIRDFEYDNISDGPFANKGFTRLINRDGIKELYGQFFHIVSIDRLISTINNQETVISEWIIVCQNTRVSRYL